MPTTLIFGGSGKVSRQITRLLAQHTTPAHTVYSIIRSESQIASLKELGASPIVQSIEDSSVSSLVETIRKCSPSTIIWSAGAGGGNPERTRTVDRDGAIRAMEASAEAGVKRFILVSAIDVRDREKNRPDWYNDEDQSRSDRLWNALNPYMHAKLEADRELRVGNGKRGLDYTIVRPGRLLDDEGTGKIDAGKVHFGEGISREDVARVVIQCIENNGTSGLAFDIFGGNTPIADAVKKVADEKIDCFEGYY